MEAVKATVEESKVVNNAKVLQRSSYWYWLKTTEQGRVWMRSIIRQLLIALKFCHDRSIINRDIKPGNMVICVEDETNGRCFEQRPSEDTHFHTKMRIIDFGNAVDEFTRKHLYGLYGPSSSEQTYYYTPPEALLNASWFQGSTSTALKFVNMLLVSVQFKVRLVERWCCSLGDDCRNSLCFPIESSVICSSNSAV